MPVEENGHITANAAKQYEVTSKDLPLSCPMPDMILWNSHPRVYLPIHKTGQARCPYCSAMFIMTDFQEFQAKSAKPIADEE